MPYSIRKQFHTSLASTVLTDIQFHRDPYYYYLGKLDPWGVVDTPPVTPSLTPQTDRTIRDNIAFFKQIGAADVSLMTVRNTWTSGVVYVQWDDSVDMDGQAFFVVNGNKQVYKCLFNAHGTASTVMPTSTSYSPFFTSDGYLWKYMYTVPTFKENKFSSASLIPVQTALTDGFYSKGALDSVVINDGGTGYNSDLLTYITVSGSSGSGAILIPKISHVTGSILEVIVVDGGINYNAAYPPLLTVHVMTGQTPGTNLYWENNTIGTALLEAVVSQGVIRSVAVIDPGQHYPHDMTTMIDVTGDGVGMVLTPIVYNGAIIDTVISDAGQGYTYANLMVSGNGTDASLSPLFASSDFVSDQNIVEQSAVDGAIYAIQVMNSGSGYTGTTVVTIDGDGTGAVATPTIVAGSITAVTITGNSWGSGYSRATVSFSDINRISTGNTDATAYAILPPLGGHGADAVKELYGKTLAIVNPIKVNPLTTNFNQDYRQYGLIKKPRNLFTNAVATLGFDSNTYAVTFDTVANLAVDQILILNGKYQYLVVYINGLEVYLQPLHTANVDPVGNLINGANTYVASNVVARPTINKYSGELIYSADELPFIFSESQGLTIKTYIAF